MADGDDQTPGDDIEPSDDGTTDDDQGTYPAKIVKGLRKENANYRERVRKSDARVDELSRTLFAARVSSLGLLTDPSDMPFDTDLLDDDQKLTEAVKDLITRKPHLRAARKPSGDVGAGVKSAEDKAAPSFANMFSRS